MGGRGNDSSQTDGLQESSTTFQTSNGAMLEELLEGVYVSLHSLRDSWIQGQQSASISFIFVMRTSRTIK